MKNIENYNSTSGDELIDKYRSEIANIIEENGLTADEVEEAYHEVLGISEGGVSEKVSVLVKQMNDLVDTGFPLNRLADLSGLKRQWENMIPDFMSYVDSMKVSENEKRMLKSIIDENRTGEVSVYLEGEHLIDLQVPEVKSGEAKALQFRTFLENVIKTIPEGKKYEITFTEN